VWKQKIDIWSCQNYIRCMVIGLCLTPVTWKSSFWWSCILSKYLSCRDRDVIHRSNWKFQNERIMYLHQLKVTQRNKLSSLMTSSPFAITILFSLLCHSLGLREHLIWKVFEIWCWQNTSASHDHTGIRPFYKFMTS